MFVQGIRSCHSFWKLQPSNPYQKLLHHAYPFIAASGQNQSHAEKQRVWSQSCGLQDMLYTILWLCSQLCYEIAANQRTLVQIELLATVGWTCGCQPFSCQCSQNVMHCRKVINATSLFKESIPALYIYIYTYLLGIPCSTGFAFVVTAEENLSYAEKQRVWSQSCGLQDLLQFSDCALGCAMRLLQTNEHLSRLSF